MARVPTCMSNAPLYTVFNRLLHHRKHVCICIDEERRIKTIITLGDVFAFFLPERIAQSHSSKPTVPEAFSHFDDSSPKGAAAAAASGSGSHTPTAAASAAVVTQGAATAATASEEPPSTSTAQPPRASSLLEAISEGNANAAAQNDVSKTVSWASRSKCVCGGVVFVLFASISNASFSASVSLYASRSQYYSVVARF